MNKYCFEIENQSFFGCLIVSAILLNIGEKFIKYYSENKNRRKNGEMQMKQIETNRKIGGKNEPIKICFQSLDKPKR